jgi:hypothetical protein
MLTELAKHLIYVKICWPQWSYQDLPLAWYMFHTIFFTPVATHGHSPSRQWNWEYNEIKEVLNNKGTSPLWTPWICKHMHIMRSQEQARLVRWYAWIHNVQEYLTKHRICYNGTFTVTYFVVNEKHYRRLIILVSTKVESIVNYSILFSPPRQTNKSDKFTTSSQRQSRFVF